MKSHVNNMSFHLGACFGFIFKYKKDCKTSMQMPTTSIIFMLCKSVFTAPQAGESTPIILKLLRAWRICSSRIKSMSFLAVDLLA